jgi:hypothetical protein
MSIMYLTIAKLWVACDKLACFLYLLLNEYDPEVCLDEFLSLSIDFRDCMERLSDVESYIRFRRDATSKGRPLVYREFGKPSSFTVRYFDGSRLLQTVKLEIERTAAIKRDQKCQELANMKAEYRNLMKRYNHGECEFGEALLLSKDGRQEPKGPPKTNCARCASKNKEDKLVVYLYE